MPPLECRPGVGEISGGGEVVFFRVESSVFTGCMPEENIERWSSFVRARTRAISMHQRAGLSLILITNRAIQIAEQLLGRFFVESGQLFVVRPWLPFQKFASPVPAVARRLVTG